MEDEAKAHNVRCVISGDVAEALVDEPDCLSLIGHEKIRGIKAEVPIYEYRCRLSSAGMNGPAAPRK